MREKLHRFPIHLELRCWTQRTRPVPGVTCPIGLHARLTRANRAWVVDPCPIDTCQSDTPSMGHGKKLCPIGMSIDTCQWGMPVTRARYTGSLCAHDQISSCSGSRNLGAKAIGATL